MRIFGRSKVTKPSAFRRTGATRVSGGTEAAAMAVGASESYVQLDLAATDEMPIVRETSPASARSAYPASMAPTVVESLLNPQSQSLASSPSHSQTGADADDGNSDVFVCRRSSPDLGLSPEAAAAAAAAEAVTLFVYGWENVEPGPLSWAFPSLRTALDAVKTMRNAIEWCIVAGHEWSSIDDARESGAVLIEQNA